MEITVIARTNTSQEKVEKIDEQTFKVYVTKSPIDGKANKAIERMLKNYFHKTATIIYGRTSQIKRVRIG